MHRGRTVLAVDCVLAGAQGQRAPRLNSVVSSPMKRTLKIIAYAIAAVPVLLLGQCVYNEIAQPRELAGLCAATSRGTSIQHVLDKAATIKAFRTRTGGSAGKNENEWFDREYLRLGKRLQTTKNLSDDYTVIFAKPGMGYYACIVVHRGNLVKDAWFEDRSS